MDAEKALDDLGACENSSGECLVGGDECLSVKSWGSLQLDERLNSGRMGIRWRPAWIWPDESEALVRMQLRTCEGPVLHVCCGASRIGDVRVDLFHPGADVRADARELPFGDESMGTVVMDPPWTIKNLQERNRFVNEAGRVLKREGVFLLHAPWMPRPTWAVLEGAWVRNQSRFRLPGSPVLLTRWKRVSR